MHSGVALIILLINVNILVTCTQKYINHEDLPNKDIGFNPNDFAKITDSDIRFLLKSIDQIATSRIHDPDKYCRSFETCHECVKSVWYPCDWCHNYGCTDKSHMLCPFLSNKINQNPRNLSSCPHIHSKNPILVPSGIKRPIGVKIAVPDPALLEKDLVCQINLNNHMTHLKGIIMKDVVYCFPTNLVISGGNEVGSFSILWGGVQSLSNELPLVVYRCDVMATSCDDCRQLPSEYGCGWCEDTQMCGLPNKCNDLLSWSLNRMTCRINNKQMYFV